MALVFRDEGTGDEVVRDEGLGFWNNEKGEQGLGKGFCV